VVNGQVSFELISDYGAPKARLGTSGSSGLEPNENQTINQSIQL